QLELELAGEVLDRRDVAQDLGDTVVEKPAERVRLDFDEVGKLLHLAELREGKTLSGRETGQRHSNRGGIQIAVRLCEPACQRYNGRRREAAGAIGRASAGTWKFGEHERADTGTPSIAICHAGCQLPWPGSARLRRTTPGCSVQDKPEARGWQRLPDR